MDASLFTNSRSNNLRSCPRQHSNRKYVGWVVLIAYSLFLAYRAHCQGAGHETATTPVWELQDLRRLFGGIGELVLGAFGESAYFVPVGFIATLVIPRSSGQLRRFPISLPALAIGNVLTILIYAVKTIDSWRLVVAVGLVFPLLGCLFGTWMGTTWLRGWRARLWFLPKVALLAFLTVLCTGGMVWLSLEEKPLPFEAVRVTPAEKRRLVDLAHSKKPQSLEEGQPHTLRLTEHDVNVLLSWGLSFGRPERKAMVSLDRDSASLRVSVTTPFGEGRLRYLNLEATGGAGVEDGILRLRVDRCRIGSVELPIWLLRSLCPLVISLVNQDRRLRPFLDATREMAVESDSIQFIYGPLDLSAELRESLSGPAIAHEELLASARSQVNALLLLAVTRKLFDPEPSFDLCLKTAFALARDRSTERNPVTENQAAILALGILLGHPRIEEFLGSVVTDDDDDPARQALYRVAVRGRSDWVKHFCVSAAITVLSDEAISDAAGLLKEDLDADAGGSGFSFADLLADRTGTTFAVSATRDDGAARAMQDRLAHGFRIEEVFPPAGDLPEGISDADLQSSYGGVGGEGYHRLIDEIERRIALCAAYQ